MKRIKKALCIVLAIVMLLGLLPMEALAAELREDPALVPVTELPELEYVEGMPYAGFASEQTNLPEKGLYTLTLRRAGDLSLGSAVTVSTVDVAAVYGKDYVMEDSRWSTETLESSGTLLENSADEASRQQAQDALDTIQGLIESSHDGAEAAPAEAQDAGAAPEMEGDPSLAALKAEQSGMPVREITDSEYTSLTERFLSEANIDPAEHVTTSSVTKVQFAPGEAEQTLIFRIRDDRESEGQEMFNLLLSAADDCTAIIEAASSLSFIIEDDEPVVHSRVSFSAEAYTAENGFVNLTVCRTEALYSYITVNVHAAGADSDVTLAFQPYQTEAAASLAVAGGEEDARFTVELCELKGADEGEIMTAEVTVPAGCSSPETEAQQTGDSYLDDFDSGSATQAYPSEITLERYGKVSIEYKDSSNPNIGTIINGKNEIGKYIAAKEGMWTYTDFSSGTHKHEMRDDGNPYLYLEYYSGWCFIVGYTEADTTINEPANRYRMVMSDVETMSTFKDAWTMLKARVYNGDEYIKSVSKYITNKNERKARLSTPLLEETNGDYSPLPWSDHFTTGMEVYRGDTLLMRPTAKVYGMILLSREYNIVVEQPAKLSYRTGELRPDGSAITKEEAPAQVALATDSWRYTGQDIQITESPAPGSPVVKGTLVGYNIKPQEGTTFFYPSNSTTLTLDDNLIRTIDEHTTKLQKHPNKIQDSSQTAVSLCYTKLIITPVYKYRDTAVTLLPPTGLPDGAEYHYLDADLEYLRAGGMLNSIQSEPNLLWDFGADNSMSLRMGGIKNYDLTWEGEKDSAGNDYYTFTATGNDPRVSIDMTAADASHVAWAKVRARNLCQAEAIELYGVTGGMELNPNSCTHVDLEKDSEWHTYIIHIPTENVRTANAVKGANLTKTMWNGKVNWIRLDPMWKSGHGAMTKGEQIQIDYVAFFATREEAEEFRSNPEPTLLWDFNSDEAMTKSMAKNSRDHVSWKGEKDSEGNDYYTFTATGNNPRVSIDMGSSDASNVTWATVRARNLCGADAIELFGHTNGKTMTGPECVHVDLEQDDKWYTYVINIPEENVRAANAYKGASLTETVWKGKVDWIRLDPIWKDAVRDAVIGDQIQIDYVAFFSNEEDARAYTPGKGRNVSFHVGDTLNLTMTTPVEGAYFTQYSQYQYINPGDTAFDKNTSGDLDVRPNEVPGRTIFYTKNEVRGHFTDNQNYIKIELNENARKYFSVRDLVPQSELKGTVRQGENVLVTDASGATVADRYTPMTGKGYTVILDPTDANDGTWRPIITISGTEQKVNGFAADFIAGNKASENVISIKAEKIDPDWYEYFSLDGGAYYSAYSLRPQSEEITASPAMQAIVTAGGVSQQMFDSSKKLGYSALRFIATTDDEGVFSINGLRAIPGDTISVLVDNNDVQQVAYITLRSVSNANFRRTATFDELKPNLSTGENGNERKTASCALNTISRIDMPIRTYYSPYVSYVYYAYQRSAVETRYNTVPIMEGDELTLSLTVVPNGAEVTGVTVTKVARNGVKTEYDAVKVSGDELLLTENYEIRLAADDLSDRDRFYVCMTAVPSGGTHEVTYTALDTGLICYTPKDEPPHQYFSYDIPNPYENLPVVGSMSGNVDSGKLTWKTIYADEKNKGTSPYAQVITLSASVNDTTFRRNMETLDKIRNGTHQAASKSWNEMLQDDESDVYDYLNQSDKDTIVNEYLADEEHEGETRQDAIDYFNSNPEEKAAYRDKFTQNAQKDAANKVGSVRLSASVALILQLEYDYDPVKREFFYSGGQYVITVCGNLVKTWYWTVWGLPVYINITGNVSLQFDGRYVTDRGVTTAREMGYYDDLTDKLETEVPWFQFGLGVKLQPGFGYYGILGVRGILELAFVTRVNIKGKGGTSTDGGTMGSFSGGIGVDLLLFSFNFTIGSIGWKTGVFKSGSLQSDGAGEHYELRPYRLGEEQAAGSLMSTLLPTAKKTLINGAMEYIRPQLVDLGDGRTMLLFLRNMSGSGRDENNASTLVYAVRNADGTWDTDANGNIVSTVVEADAQADSTFSAMRVGNKVYIAWTNAQVDPGFSENTVNAKAALQSCNIHMSVYDLNSGSMDVLSTGPAPTVIPVTEDRFVNSNVMLAQEGDSIALYYFKKDVGNTSEITDLVGMSNNYNTWARKVYDPAARKFTAVSAGTDPTEEYITILHPTLVDPMVLDLSAADYSYTDLNGATKDYRFYSYTVDRDGDQETVSDRELWVQLTNISDGRSYYPIPIDANKSSIAAPKLTKLGDDVYLSWLSDNVIYNTISAQDLFDGLDREDGTEQGAETGAPYSSLERIRSLSAEEIAVSGWYKLPYQQINSEYSELYTLLQKLSDCDLISISHDFGSSFDYDGEQTGMTLTDHKLVAGGDGSLYLFWTAQDNENIESDFGRELYGAAMYLGNDDEDTGKPAWSSGVKLTDYGKVIDELTVSVGSDKGAILVGNLYTQEIAPDGSVVYSDHELAEIDFTAGNSLEIDGDHIVLSDPYPVEGERVHASMAVKNNGLLPAKRYSLTVNGETETIENADIYPGSSSVVGKDFTAGAGGALTVSAEVRELDETQALAVKEDGANAASVSTKTGPVANFGTASVYSMPEEIIPLIDASILEENSGKDFESLLNLMVEPFDPEIQAVLRATTGTDAYADYVVCVPVTNIGNQAGKNLKVTVSELKDTQTDVVQGDVLGETTVPLLPVKTVDEDGEIVMETVYAVIPLKALDARKHLDEMGVMRLKISFTLDGTALEESLFARRQLLRNQLLEVNNGIQELSIAAGETAELQTTAYPWDGLKDLVYSSMDNGVAMVSPEGVLIGTGTGSTYIIIEDMSSNPLYTAVRVNVTECPRDDTCPMTAFSDLDKTSWYHDGVHWALENEVMNGVGGGRFAPDSTTTRAMIVTMLYRMEGEPASDHQMTYLDVADGQWYTDAIRWASEHGIVNGYSADSFGPSDNLTREQLVTILYRYAKLKGKGFSGMWSFPLTFDDAASVSDWANEAMCWMVMNGVIQGTGNNMLSPKSGATRAQVATVLMRCKNLLTGDE